MTGTIRSFDNESKDRMKERIITICESVAEAMECTAEVEI